MLIKPGSLRILFFVLIAIVILVNLFFLFSGLVNPEGLNIGGEDKPAYSINRSKATWALYHAWNVIIPAVLLYAEVRAKRKLFLICLLLAFILFYYPFFTQR